MEKITFVRKNGKYKGRNALPCSPEIYKHVAFIAESCNMKLGEVTNRLLDAALNHIEITDEDHIEF